MELSMQSRIDYNGLKKIRQIVIENEKLHINDKIDYNRFLELYNKYRNDIDESIFARYILDISLEKFNNLTKGKIKTTSILSREYVFSKEIDIIKKQVKEFLEEQNIPTKVTYSIVKELYDRFSGKLDMESFAEEVLGIKYNSVQKLKSNPKMQRNLFLYEAMSRDEVRKIQNAIILGKKLHISDTITLPIFYELYKDYGKDISESEFAVRILQISQDSLNKLKEKSKKESESEVVILSHYAYSSESILKLREIVISQENLHIGDEIDYKRFQELHKKYGGALSEELFAEEILDVTIPIRNWNGETEILKNIDIPKEYVLELRNKIAEENDFIQNQEITKEKLEELYQKYGGLLCKKIFASRILELGRESYNSIMRNDCEKVKILKSYNPNKFLELRKKIIVEEKLKINDKITYKKLKKMHQKYAQNENIVIFAERVFDITSNEYYNLKSGKTAKAEILKKEPIPEDEELYEEKCKILLQNKLHIEDEINYNKFKKIYAKYVGILSEELFAEKILDLSNKSFKKIKDNNEANTKILLKTKPKEEDIRKLKREVILDNNLYPQKKIDLETFNKLYKGYQHILSEKLFATKILGINYKSLSKLKNKKSKKVNVLNDLRNKYLKRSKYLNDKEVEILKESLILGLSYETIATRLIVTIPFLKRNIDMLFRYERLSHLEIEQARKARGIDSENLKIQEPQIGDTQKKDTKERNKRQEDAKKLEEKIISILKEFELSQRDNQTISKYLENCSERFKYGELKQEELSRIEECIDFLVADYKWICFYSRVCVSFGLYKKASIFVAKNIDNDGICDEEKMKLVKLKKDLNEADKKQRAVNMIANGVMDAKEIARQTGIAEVDILAMKKRMKQNKENINEKFDDFFNYDDDFHM